MNPRNCAGLTWVEVLVLILVVCVLITLFLPRLTSRPHRGRLYEALSNMRHLQGATEMMALDGMTRGDTNLGWPGDTGGTFDRWAYFLVAGKYLTTNDLRKLISGPGKWAPANRMPRKEDSALLVYAVGETNNGSAVFLTTANFTNTLSGGTALSSNAIPYGDRGFVVFRKGGDGAILTPNQVGKTDVIGEYVPLCR